MKKDIKKKRDYIYYDLTRSMCRKCREIVDAQIIFRDGRVFLRSICPQHGASEALIAASSDWYTKVINSKQAGDRPGTFSKEINEGCPFDCGLCTWHEKACHLPVISITNVCNLKCPICFTYNRDDLDYFMPVEEFKQVIDWIVTSEGSVDLINITGGEPALHPQLFELIDLCRRQEIGRVTLNSNGLKLAEDEEFVKKLAGYGVYVILSFNTFNRSIAKKMHGADVLDKKLQALQNLEKYGVQTTLLNVSVKDLNDKEIGKVIDYAVEKDFVRSVTIQNMTYTGFGGGKFVPRKHLPIDEVIDNIVTRSATAANDATERCSSHKKLHNKTRFSLKGSTYRQESLTQDDFVPLPGSHPLCYSVCYLFRDGDETFPLGRLFSADEYYDILGKKYLVRPGEKFQQMLTDKIDEIWARKDSDPQAEGILKMMKNMIGTLYPAGENLSPFERQKKAEKFIKTIYIHSHMDEDTFDLSRVTRCGDLVPGKDKTFIPACSYNLFYRMKDERFWLPAKDEREGEK